MSPWTKVSSAKPDDLSSILRTYVVCCRIFDHTVNPKIVLLTEKNLVVAWLPSTHLYSRAK